MKKIVYIGPEEEVSTGNDVFKRGIPVEIKCDLTADFLLKSKAEFALAKEEGKAAEPKSAEPKK